MDRGNPWLRKLDSVLGPALLLLFRGIRFRRNKPSRSPQRIGLIKPAALGDTVLVSAVAEDLRKAFPGARVILFSGSGNAGLARLMTCFDEVVALPLRTPWSAAREMRARQLDWMIDCDSWPRISALWAALSGAQWTLGFKTKAQSRHFAFDQVVEHRGDLHEIENYRNLLRALEVPTGSPPHGFPETESRARNPFLILCHLWPGGTQSQMKEWPAAHWKQLLENLLSHERRLEFAFTGGPEDRNRTDSFLSSLPAELRSHTRSVAGASLKDTVMLLKSCGLVVSVNTGLLHIADAVGAPVVGLHGPTNPRRWGPVGPGQIAMLADNPRAGHLNLGFEYDEGPSVMEDLNPDEVAKAVLDLAASRSLGWQEVQRR